MKAPGFEKQSTGQALHPCDPVRPTMESLKKKKKGLSF